MILVIGQAIIDGISEGGIIALAAISITLIFRISHFANVATGDLMTVGAYVTFMATTVLALPLAISVVVSVLVTGVIGYVAYILVFRPLRNNTVALFITSIGLALALRAVVQMIWGGGTLAYTETTDASIRFSGLVLPVSSLVVILVCAGVTVGFFWALHSTRLGREIRATANDEDLARVSGIKVSNVTVAVWVAASALAGLAGVLLGVSTAISPEMGWNLLLAAFAAAILGGLGNTVGAVVGGLVIGIAMQFAILVVPAGYKLGIAFLIMILVLIFKPSGIIPTKARV